MCKDFWQPEEVFSIKMSCLINILLFIFSQTGTLLFPSSTSCFCSVWIWDCTHHMSSITMGKKNKDLSTQKRPIIIDLHKSGNEHNQYTSSKRSQVLQLHSLVVSYLQNLLLNTTWITARCLEVLEKRWAPEFHQASLELQLAWCVVVKWVQKSNLLFMLYAKKTWYQV